MSTVSYGATPQLQRNVWKKRWVPNGNKNNLPSRFRFADYENCGDFMLLFCIGRLRNVQSFKTHVLSCCSTNYIFFFSMFALPSPLWFGLGPKYLGGAGSNPVDVWIFSRPFFVQFLWLQLTCEDRVLCPFFDTYSISCRRLMIEKIATHLADFSPRLQSNTRALYQVILHRALKWTACSLCRFFPSVTFLVLFCVLLHQWEILPHKTVLGCCI